MNSHLFVFGLGYSGLAVARDFADQGWRISGSCRSSARCKELAGRSEGGSITALPFDGTHGSIEIEKAVTEADHILVCIPPAREPEKESDGGDPVLAHFAELLASSRRLKWLGYLSTTGVYGDRGGDWVDETSPLRPTSARATRRAAVESLWMDLGERQHVPVHIFRLAGIYGPGRNVIRSLLDGKARRIIKKDHVFSRIHLADLVTILKASMANPRPGAIYNVADDEAAPPAETIEYASRLLGIEPPQAVDFDSADLSPMAQSFYADCKRVSNARIKEELGVRLAYPSYREGQEALLAGELDAGEETIED